MIHLVYLHKDTIFSVQYILQQTFILFVILFKNMIIIIRVLVLVIAYMVRLN